MPRGRLALSSEQETPKAADSAAPSGEAKPAESKTDGGAPGGRGPGGRGGPGGGRGGRGGRGPGGGRGRGGPGGGGGRGRGRGDRDDRDRLIENVVRINRSAAVVKGGRRFSFSALVVVGDGNGKVGIGYGKANGVPNAVEKGVKEARKSLFKLNIVDGSIPHPVKARYRSSVVTLEPASPGTGIIAGAGVRAVCEAAGIKNILTKSHGSGNPINVVKAVEAGLRLLKTRKSVEHLRGVKLEGNAGTWRHKQTKAGARKAAEAQAAEARQQQ